MSATPVKALVVPHTYVTRKGCARVCVHYGQRAIADGLDNILMRGAQGEGGNIAMGRAGP